VSLQIDVRDLPPGSDRVLHLSEPVTGLATEVARVPEDRPLAIDVHLESVVEGLLVSGTVAAPTELCCARCLKPLQDELRVDVQELFVPGAPGEADEYPLTDGFADLEPMVRDAVMPALPFAPLCSPGCLGLCGRCGGDRNAGECACEPEVDARWAPLAELNLPT
jgi:DUF177 domain-containing protein